MTGGGVKFSHSVHTVECGNVEGIELGSESPVTPFNYIEFWGEGTLKGIKGNKFPLIPVEFHAWVEDRNEPGSFWGPAMQAGPAGPAGPQTIACPRCARR